MIDFTVGDKEKHNIKFSFNSFTGATKILIDDKVYSSTRIMFIGHTPFAFQVGDKEKHNVRIELNNPLFFALRGSYIKAFVDEKLIRQDHIEAVGGLFLLILIFISLVIVFTVIPIAIKGIVAINSIN